MGWGNESLFKWSWSHDQNGRQAHIWQKTFKKSSPQKPKMPMTLILGMQHWVLKYYQVCSNDDPGLTLTYFYGKVKFGPLYFCVGKR